MELAVVIFLVIATIFVHLKLFKGSVFGISLSDGTYAGFFIFYNFLVYAAPSAILLNLLTIDKFWVAYKVKQEYVFQVTLLVLLCYLLFLTSLYLFSRLSPKYFRLDLVSISENEKAIYRRMVYCALSLSVFFIAFLYFVFDLKHSFTLSLASDLSISDNRLAIDGNRLSRYCGYYFYSMTPFLAAIIASPVFKENPLGRCISIIATIFIATWGGSKGPILFSLLIMIFTHATFVRSKISLKRIFFSIILLCFFLIAVFLVVGLQYQGMREGELTLFWDYLYQRIFIAQMIGMYEEFSIHIMNYQYFFHGIPFASWFMDFPVFHKDLMMITEDRIDPSQIGIKNTFFIAEAYAMGGWFFIIPAVFIYALNFSLSFVLIVKLMNTFIVKNPSYNKVITAFFLFSYVTVFGGFSDLMLFKITVMLVMILTPILFLGYLCRFRYSFGL